MKTPRSYEEYLSLALTDQAEHEGCTSCGQQFTRTSATSPRGWGVTQLLGLCEGCAAEAEVPSLYDAVVTELLA